MLSLVLLLHEFLICQFLILFSHLLQAYRLRLIKALILPSDHLMWNRVETRKVRLLPNHALVAKLVYLSLLMRLEVNIFKRVLSHLAQVQLLHLLVLKLLLL